MEVPVPAMSISKSEVVYDDEPKNPKELDRHPDKQAIMSSAQKEVQQLIDMQVGVQQTDEQVRKLEQDPTVRILNSRFVHRESIKSLPRTIRSILTSGRVGSQRRASMKSQVSTACGTHFHPPSDFQPLEH